MKKRSLTLIAPSVLSADFLRLADQIKAVERAGADWLHLDVMDGHFVPNITFGPMVVRAIRRISKLPLDTHLMIEQPERYLADFREAGSDRITVHLETCPHLHRTIEQIHDLGAKAGVTINPATPAELLEPILPFVELVLIMTVNPGFGGQTFIGQMLDKIQFVRSMIDGINPKVLLEVDGGVGPDNAGLLVDSGANVLVAGNSIFGEGNPAIALKRLLRSVGR